MNNINETLNEYYLYDGVYIRVTAHEKTGRPIKAEGYFKGQGFMSVELLPVIRNGEWVAEKEFKAAVIALR